MDLPRLADLHSGDWVEHSRFSGIAMKGLLTAQDNPLASVNAVQVPPQGVISRHHHAQQIETVFVIAGRALLTLDQAEVPIRTGHVVAIPAGLEHALRNEGTNVVELLTFFTPPLA